jgi:AAA+ superfamily predicted ATPase
MSTDTVIEESRELLVGPASSRRPAGLPPAVPAWFAEWAREMADLYFSANACVFVLHGNVNDLIYCRRPPVGAAPGSPPIDQFCGLSDFIAHQIFGNWDVVVSYDLGRGIQAEAGSDPKRLKEMMQYLTSTLGSPATWSRDPDVVLTALDRLIQRNLLEDNLQNRKRMAFLFPYAQYLVPAGDHSMLARTQAARLVRFLSWAQNPYIKRVNIAFCLIAETLNEISDELVTNPHVATLEIPLPSDEIRRKFIESQWAERFASQPAPGVNAGVAAAADRAAAADWQVAPSSSLGQSPAPPAPPAPVATASPITLAAPASLSVDAVTQLSNGLNLVNLNVALSRSAADASGVDIQRFRKLKKGLIERQCHDLVTFVEPSHKLDMVVGHQAAIERLRQDARWIAEGRLDATPMGYLICGPVGTGKTFLAECYAGSIGIPCLVLRNFRSKYVGETEGNLEKVLTVLRSLGPVVVIVDEADAALGNREMGGDSGTSARVFSMIASQMGNTKYRGRIIWMLLTSRPELLPIDLKRQGRAEVHIPLFYPDNAPEITEMFRVMAAKNKIPLAEDAIPPVDPSRNLSGADIESVLLSAKREMLAAGQSQLNRADLEQALKAFIPSAQGLEKSVQELAAVLECTDMRFLPETWRTKLEQPEARAKLQRDLVQIRELIDRD